MTMKGLPKLSRPCFKTLIQYCALDIRNIHSCQVIKKEVKYDDSVSPCKTEIIFLQPVHLGLFVLCNTLLVKVKKLNLAPAFAICSA